MTLPGGHLFPRHRSHVVYVVHQLPAMQSSVLLQSFCPPHRLLKATQRWQICDRGECFKVQPVSKTVPFSKHRVRDFFFFSYLNNSSDIISMNLALSSLEVEKSLLLPFL